MNLTPEWLTAIATIILVFATIIYVFFTYKLTKETVKLREVETSPFVSLHIDGSSWVLKLIVKYKRKRENKKALLYCKNAFIVYKKLEPKDKVVGINILEKRIKYDI